jgi:hypothetical protein
VGSCADRSDGAHPRREGFGVSGLLDAALGYAALGWRVLPVHGIVDGGCTCRSGRRCTKPGKHPVAEDWPRRATADPATIAARWREQPAYNVGILTGAASGVWALDVDPRHGGDATLDTLVREHGPLPATTTALTGGGGQHLIYRYSPGIGCRAGSGLDVRGDGRQIVAAPSRHWSGGEYRWAEGAGPWEIPAADAPGWLTALATGAAVGGGASPSGGPHRKRPADYWRRIAGGVPEGERNIAITSVAGLLLGDPRIEPHLAEALVHGFNSTRCDPPLPMREVEAAINSIVKRELRKI